MLNLLILIGRGLALAFRGHQELVLENLALRQQLVPENGRQAPAPRGERPTVLDSVDSTLAELALGVGNELFTDCSLS